MEDEDKDKSLPSLDVGRPNWRGNHPEVKFFNLQSSSREAAANPTEHFWKTITTSMMLEATECEISDSAMTFINEKALQMMAKMGYKSGTGLGRKEEGRLDLVDLPGNLGKRGFGLKIAGLEADNVAWDFTVETVDVQEEVKWISSAGYDWWPQPFDGLPLWIVKGPPKVSIDDESRFCDPILLQKILKAKGVFDELDAIELCKARSRANPFETIRSAFFMNRAALKMANIDAITNFIFTDIDRNPYHGKHTGPYYFADVCAGPGGFSEYVLWRKKWLFKGFGFTLKGEHDFELGESQCASPVTFNPQYGVHEDGDVCCPENIRHFSERVLHETEGVGVHFMMSDGGFSVEGNENLQEILSKQLYVCQCLMALEIVRPHGHFVTKLFDLFTLFSVGLIFLMYNCFEKIAIVKPNTSRPANSERYLICYGLKMCAQTLEIRKYLAEIAAELWELRQVQHDPDVDINEILPLSIITADETFLKYVIETNNKIGTNQVVGLLKLAAFCRNPTLAEPRQEDLRVECLKHWRIPDKPKVPLKRFTTDDLLMQAVHNPDFMFIPPKQVCDIRQLKKLLGNNNKNWLCVLSACNRRTNICNFYAGVGGSRVYRLQRYRWVKVKKMQLIRGTLLYGEMVKENVIHKSCMGPQCETLVQKHSLHVIDALRLGETSLADLPFNERLDLIETYCQAVNHESRADHARIRMKTPHSLQELCAINPQVVPGRNEENNYCVLPVLGFNSIKEYYVANSVLLLRASWDQLFHSTFSTRIQVFLGEDEAAEPRGSSSGKITLSSLSEFVKDCL